jgi:hypothetical protein
LDFDVIVKVIIEYRDFLRLFEINWPILTRFFSYYFLANGEGRNYSSSNFLHTLLPYLVFRLKVNLILKWLDPCEWASNIPTNVYVSNENILGAIVGVIQKVNSQTGDRESLFTYNQSVGDIAIDPYGTLYIGSNDGVKRLDLDTGQPLQDVGLNIFA